jgi:hypothetical protein
MKTGQNFHSILAKRSRSKLEPQNIAKAEDADAHGHAFCSQVGWGNFGVVLPTRTFKKQVVEEYENKDECYASSQTSLVVSFKELGGHSSFTAKSDSTQENAQ